MRLVIVGVLSLGLGVLALIGLLVVARELVGRCDVAGSPGDAAC